MTDQEFLSQNLDILYQNTPFSTFAKDWIFFSKFSEIGNLAAFLLIALCALSLSLLAFFILLEDGDEKSSVNGKTKISKTIYNLFQKIFLGGFALSITIFMIGAFVELVFSASLSSYYIKLDELNKLPILKDSDNEQRDYFKKLAAQYVVNAEKRYSNQSKFNDIVGRGPDLEEVTIWLIRTIKDKPYEKQEIADKKLKLINDL